jgi:TfoX/Sxy family transcriptional regulator of competence genes
LPPIAEIVSVPFDHELAERLRIVLRTTPDVTERKMFGGLAFLVDGHMTVVASGQGGLMVRVDPTRSKALVATTPAEPAEMRGRPMQGWLRLVATDVPGDNLEEWVTMSTAYVATLPRKASRSDRD